MHELVIRTTAGKQEREACQHEARVHRRKVVSPDSFEHRQIALEAHRAHEQCSPLSWHRAFRQP